MAGWGLIFQKEDLGLLHPLPLISLGDAGRGLASMGEVWACARRGGVGARWGSRGGVEPGCWGHLRWDLFESSG